MRGCFKPLAWSLLVLGACIAVAAAVHEISCASLAGGRAYFTTDVWAPGTYLLWLFCLAIGHAYVACASCNRRQFRKDALSCFKMLCWGSVFYWLGPVNGLYGPCSGYWGENAGEFCVFYVLGLQFTYADVPVMQGLVLTLHGIRRYTRLHWIVIGLAMLIVIPEIAYHLYLYSTVSLLWQYLVGIAVFIMGVALIGYLWRHTHHVHIHHYILFGILIPLVSPALAMVMVPVCVFAFFGVRFRSWPSTCALGLVSGITVEGIARWGMDPLFVRNRVAPLVKNSTSNVVGGVATGDGPTVAVVAEGGECVGERVGLVVAALAVAEADGDRTNGDGHVAVLPDSK